MVGDVKLKVIRLKTQHEQMFKGFAGVPKQVDYPSLQTGAESFPSRVGYGR